MSTPDPLAALRPVLAHALVALDFDGTLAPIVADPATSRLLDGALELLTALASRVGGLAVVTGRPADTVVRLGGLDVVPGLVVLGHYGLQRWSAGELTTPPPDPAVADLRAVLGPLLPPGATVEDKVHSVVVHTRTGSDPQGQYDALAGPLARLAAAYGLEAVTGRFVWELRPAGTDKGGALRSLLGPEAAAVLVAGDDLGDLPMFAAAAAASVPSVRVAVTGADAPPQVAAAADLAVAGPAGLVALLRGLL